MTILLSLFSAHGLVLELLLTSVLFCRRLDRRTCFAGRAAGSILCCLAVSVLWGMLPLPGSGWVETARYTLLSVLGIAALYFCFRVQWRQAVFYMTAICVVQHFSFKIADNLSAAVQYVTGTSWLRWILYPLGVIACNLLLAVPGARRMHSGETKHIGRTIVALLFGGMLLFTNLFQNLFLEYKGETPLQLRAVFELFDLLCCLFILSLIFELCRRGRLEYDNDILQHVLHQQRQQMQTSKETIELINIKCHDLKHQLARLGPRISESEIAELNESINVYGASVKTGCEAADVVLTEKNLVCEHAGFQLESMVDGAALSILSDADIYAMLGNILDNAIEAMRHVEAGGDRCIRLKIRTAMGMLSIHCENPYAGTLRFENGLPVTTKENHQYHGFGMKSIRLITEKYGGYLSLQTADNVFSLDILIPSHAQKEKDSA